MLLSEFTIILGNMTATIAADGTIVSDLMKGGYDWKKEMLNLKRHLMDYFVASSYQMNWDGTTTGLTNYISETEFDTLMGKIKKYAA